MSKTPYTEYTHEELLNAYANWVEKANADKWTLKERVDAWEAYCDVRDAVPRGTSQAKRFRLQRTIRVVCPPPVPASGD